MADKPAFLKASDISGLTDMVAQMDTAGGKPMDKLETGTTLTSNFRRILPQHPNMTAPVQVVPVHFKVGPSGRQLVCPRLINGGECPICAQGFAWIKDGAEKEGKEILPSWRAYLNVIRLTPKMEIAEDKVYVLSLNKTQFEDLTDEFTQYGDVTDLETGRPVDFAAKKTKRGNFEFNIIKYRVGEAAPFEVSEDLIAETVDLSSYIEYHDAAGILEIVQGQGAASSAEGNGKLPFQLPEAKAPEEAAPESNPGGFAPLEDAEEEETAPHPEAQPVSDPAEALKRIKAKAGKKS